MFMEEVDHEKYPDAGQKYRFEPVNPGQTAREPVPAGEKAEAIVLGKMMSLTLYCLILRKRMNRLQRPQSARSCWNFWIRNPLRREMAILAENEGKSRTA